MLISKKPALLAALCLASLGGNDAWAQVRSMVVLVDASGSMTALRSSDGLTRFEGAQNRTRDWVNTFSGLQGSLEVAVFTFQNDATALPRTSGFVTPAAAIAAIESLPGPGGLTPLAGSLCDAVSLLVSRNTPGNRILVLGSDGLENNTPSVHPCFGPSSTTDVVPYTAGSWQNLVYTQAVGSVVVQVELFDNSGVVNTILGNFDSERGSLSTAFALDGAPTLLQFATALARDSGGTVTVSSDSTPLPVFGDFDGDGCVTDADSFDLIQSLGQTVPPGNPAFDLTSDGVIDVDDFLAWSANLGNGCA